MKPTSDLLLGALLAVFGAVMLTGTYSIQPPVFESFGAAPVPRASALILMGLAAILLASAAIRLRRSPGAAAFILGASAWRRTLAVLAVLILHSVAIGPFGIGFVVATIPMLIAMFVILGGRAPRFLALATGLAITVTIALYLVFTRLFQIDLP